MVIWRHLFWLSKRIRDKQEGPKYLKKSPRSLANTSSDALAILKKMIAGKKTEGETYRIISKIWEWRNDNANGRVTRPIFSLSPIFTKWARPAPPKIKRTGRTPELEIRQFVNCDFKARTRTKGECSSWEEKYKEKDRFIRYCCSVLRTHLPIFRAKLDHLQYSKKSSKGWDFAMGKSTR